MRNQTILRAAFLVLASAAPAAAQTETHTRTEHSVHRNGSSRSEVRINGVVRFSADGRSVESLAPGASLLLDEERRGSPRRRALFRPGGSGVSVEYSVDGVRAPLDAAGRQWIARMLEDESRRGMGARERVSALRREGGVERVLREIDQVEGGGARRAWYTALLGGTPRLRPAETVRVVRHAARSVESSGDLRAVLSAAAPDGPEEWTAVLEGAEEIDSDGDRASLLVSAAERAPLGDARVRDALFRAADGIRSDGDRARVLIRVVRRPSVPEAAVVAALRDAERIDSDGDRARVLTSVPTAALRSGAARGAYRRTLATIRSDGDRERAAMHLARGEG